MSNFYKNYFSYDIFCDISINVKKNNNILFCSILNHDIAL